MHIGDKHFAHRRQATEKRRIVAVKTVGADPGKTHTDPALMRDNLQRQRHLRLEAAVRLENAGLRAALRIITPRLRQIQPLIDQRHAAITT